MLKTIMAKAAHHGRTGAIAASGVVLALGCASSSAFALDTQPSWQGIATTTASTTAQCDGAYGSTVGETEVSVFRPKIKSTDTNTYLSFVFLRAAETLENRSELTVHQMHGAGSLEGYGVSSKGEFYEFTGTYSLTISPAEITASTPVITISGKIANLGNNPGCIVTFTGVYGKRVD